MQPGLIYIIAHISHGNDIKYSDKERSSTLMTTELCYIFTKSKSVIVNKKPFLHKNKSVILLS